MEKMFNIQNIRKMLKVVINMHKTNVKNIDI